VKYFCLKIAVFKSEANHYIRLSRSKRSCWKKIFFVATPTKTHVMIACMHLKQSRGKTSRQSDFAHNVHHSFMVLVGDLTTSVWYLSFLESRSTWLLQQWLCAIIQRASSSSVSRTRHQCTGLWRNRPSCPKPGQMLTDLLFFFNVHSAAVCNNLLVKNLITPQISPH